MSLYEPDNYTQETLNRINQLAERIEDLEDRLAESYKAASLSFGSVKVDIAKYRASLSDQIDRLKEEINSLIGPSIDQAVTLETTASTSTGC